MESQIIANWIITGILVAFVAFDKAKAWFSKSGGSTKKLGNNPHPCQKHADELKKHGEQLARLEEASQDAERRLERIENKLNGLG